MWIHLNTLEKKYNYIAWRHNTNTTTHMSPGPTPTANPYAPKVVAPVVQTSTGNAAMPATVSTTTGASVIAASQAQRAAQNTIGLQESGMRVAGGSRRKRKRSNKRKRSKRGGAPTPSPSPIPKVIPVPQFAGAHNAGANGNSAASNTVLMNAGAQAVYDNPNAPPSNTKVI